MNSSTILVANRVVTGYEDFTPGWIAISAGHVMGCGPGLLLDASNAIAVEGTIIPGFVDIHSHGAAGIDFGAADLNGAQCAADYHSSRGSTTMLASIASASTASLIHSVEILHESTTTGALAGIHLEGPYLSPDRRGAHHLALLRQPDVLEMQRLLDAGRGSIRVVTIAPELPGAEAVIRMLASNGITVAMGHTNADSHTAAAAFDWGVTLATHLFNGMPEMEHRAPGPVGAALVDSRIGIELIFDGHHVSDEAIEIARHAAPDRYMLVSDSMQATGQPDGEYEIAGSRVKVHDGVARLADGSSLAGSTKTVSDCFPRLLSLAGMTLLEAVRATSINPATVIGSRLPGLQPGSSADLLILHGRSSHVTRVMRGGSWLA